LLGDLTRSEIVLLIVATRYSFGEL
jgi:hypothetical protein